MSWCLECYRDHYYILVTDEDNCSGAGEQLAVRTVAGSSYTPDEPGMLLVYVLCNCTY